MNDFHQRQYTGIGKCQYQPLQDAVTQPEPYIPNTDLIEAVNMALFLRRPLLLEGEPGCGKTRLAFAVAHELGYPLYEIYIRSTSKAQDLLYSFDAVRRLYDLQERVTVGERMTRKNSREDDPPQGHARPDIVEKEQYVELGELGKAIRHTAEQDEPSVVLIDEIDKADLDFPNDLLLEFDRLQFGIKEIPDMRYDAFQGKTREARRDVLPLLIVTSNRERNCRPHFCDGVSFITYPFPARKT